MTFVSHADHGEDVLIRRAFRGVEGGFWIDVGAGDGLHGSVTRGLRDEGWRGVNLEPDPGRFALLAASRPGELNLAAAAAALPGTRPFHLARPPGRSTLDPDRAARLLDGRGLAAGVVEVAATTIAALCRHHAPGGALHLLRIAAAGAEAEVLEGVDLDRARPWLVLVAAPPDPDRPSGDAGGSRDASVAGWEEALRARGYRLAWDDGTNRFLVAEEHARLADALRLPPNPADRYRRADALAREAELRTLEAALTGARRREGALDAARAALETAVASRDAALREAEASRAEQDWLREGLGAERARAREAGTALEATRDEVRSLRGALEDAVAAREASEAREAGREAERAREVERARAEAEAEAREAEAARLLEREAEARAAVERAAREVEAAEEARRAAEAAAAEAARTGVAGRALGGAGFGLVFRPAWWLLRPVARPLGWRARGFLTRELRLELDRVRDGIERLENRAEARARETPAPPVIAPPEIALPALPAPAPSDEAAEAPAAPEVFEASASEAPAPFVPMPAPDEVGPEAAIASLPVGRGATPPRAGRAPRRAVHQFHPGSATGDAITNGMLATRALLRAMGFDSEIFVENRHEAFAREMFLLDDLPAHDDYVLMLRHSLGCERLPEIAALPPPVLLVYHNITPAGLIDHDPELARLARLGRAQLALLRARSDAAIADSEYNAIELRGAGFARVYAAQTLFDVAALRARAASRAAPDARPDADAGAGAFEGITFLFVGRVLRSKGQADLVDAYAAYRARAGAPASRLVLVGRAFGTDDYVAELRRRIGRHDLAGEVLVTGPVEQAALEDWFRNADIYVSMSRHEGFGVPLVEAMAAGLPIAALDAGAIPFTLGEAGLVVPDAPDAMADAMLRLATDPALRVSLARAGRDRLERFSLDRQRPVLARALAFAGAIAPGRPDRAALRAAMRVTVAGHASGSYSLAAINRAVARDLDRELPGRVRLLPVEGEPGAPLSDLPREEWPAIEALAARPAGQAGPSVVLSQHYPVWVPPERPDLCLASFWWEEGAVPEATIATLEAGFDAVLVASAPVADALLASGLRLPVRVVGHAPPLDAFEAVGAARGARDPERPYTFLHVSSAFPRKGVDVLLEAWALAFAAGERVRLVLKTFPNPHNDVAARIETLRARLPDLPEIVHLDRDLEPDALARLYAEADAMVLPSRGEGFLLPAAEAIAAGLPLVASEVGGHRAFVGETDALLVAGRHAPSRSHLASSGSLWFEPDRDALVEAMRRLFDDRAAGRAMAERARAALPARLDRAAQARRLADTIARLLAEAGPVRLPRRIAVVSSWAVRCGIADYSRMLLDAMPADLPRAVVLADTRAPDRAFGDAAEAGVEGGAGRAVRQCWTNGTTFDHRPLARAIASEDPEVLSLQHQPGLIPWSGLAALLEDPRVARRVVLATLHNTREIDSLGPDERARLVAALGTADRLLVHTADDLDRLRAAGLDRISVIPQGAMAPPFAEPTAPRALPEDATPILGAYGFLLAPKNFGALIEALRILRGTWPTMKLRMVTALHDDKRSEVEHHRLLALADRIGVGGEVEWHTGFWPHRTSMELLRGCDLLVLPYRPSLEASSAALRTALASLVPTAVTPIATFAEAEAATARLAGDTPEAIAAGAAVLLKDRARRAALVEAQAAWMDARRWDRVARRFAGLGVQLLGRRDREIARGGAAASADGD